ncbi:MAG: hypothetical protein H7Z16_02695 [Pyrinomonadaceae bacterium]|nr:hypothetical protein [Pyrinomonadaceae bacterium]
MNEGEQPQAVTERVEPRSSGEVVTPPSLADPAAALPRFSPGLSRRPEQLVELDIEELVLQGFDPANRYAIGDALERELTRLSSEQGSPIAATEDVEIAHVNGGAIDVKPGSSAEAIGIQLARAIYGGLGK